MIVLYNQHWDLIPGKEEAYTKFVIDKHLPTMKKIGINMVGGFLVVVGGGPRITAAGAVDGFQKLQKALETEEFAKITAEIQQYVFNYDSRILTPTGRVKANKYTIQLGVWKFNQYFNIIPGREKEYAEFVLKDHLPTIEKLGIKMTGGWRVVVGSGPYIVAEGTAASIVEIAKAIRNPEFSRITRVLTSNYVTDYSSRILAPTGRIDLPFIMGEMMKGF
jgi:formylmethanofuran dehydrogenase subunit C